MVNAPVNANAPANADANANADVKAARPRALVKPPPTRRRAVQQVIEPMPRIAADRSGAPAAAPAPAPQWSQSQAQSPPSTAPAAPLNSCDAGGCTDTNGMRYNGGAGNTLVGPRGQLCTNGLVTPQCF